MSPFHTQYVIDTARQKLVIVSFTEFNSIVKKLEDLIDLRLYDSAEENDDASSFMIT